MADKKISELVSLAGVDLSDADLIPVVDVSTAEAKAVSISGIKAAFATTFSSQAQTEIYTTEALGRAAVADGQAFKVQGSGDVAAYEYRRTNSTTSVLIATYPSSSAVVTKNASNQVRNAYAPYVTWQHPDGDTEMDGNSNYAVIGSVGFYEKCTDATLLNVIQWRVWKTATLVDVEYRIYVRDTNAAFNLDSTARVASGTILAANMTNANAILKISLATPVQVPAGKYLFVLFKAVTDGYMGMQRWSTNTANRHGFLFNGVAGWNNSFSIGGSGYNSTAPKFFLESEELRTMPAVNTAAALSFNNALGGGLAATNVQAALQEIVSTDLVLPPSIFGVQGRECNVYFDNLLMDDASDYAISALAGLGVHQSERWTWTPAGAVTTGALTVGVYNKRTAGLISQKSTNYLAAASTAGTGLTKKVLVLGDSLVFAGVITQTLLDIAATDAMAVALYGTQGTGANKHEGHGGYTTASFVSTFSPFYDGSTINFSNYLTVNSIPAPDWVFISLGINDMSGVFPDAAVLSAITNSMGQLNTLITSIKAAGAGIKVGLMIPTPPSNSQDAFGTNYGASQPERWRIKRSLVMYARQLLANYVGQEANRIYVVPVNTALDTVNNMVRYGATPANSRTSATIARQGNGVHPDTSGYQQMGDALWAFLKFYA